MPQKNGHCPTLARDIEITISVLIQQTIAKIAQLVEHDLAKVGVAGSSPVFRSMYVFCPDGGMVDTKDLKSFGFTAVRVQVPLRVPKRDN